MQRELALQEYASLFEGILISMNVLEWEKEEKKLTGLQLFGLHRTPFHHLFIQGDRVELVAAPDYTEEYDKRKHAYYNLTLGFNDPKKKLSKKAFEKVVKIKFLNGETSYSQQEYEFLKSWIQTSGVAKLKKFFTQIVLNNQPDKAAAFIGSALQRLFAELSSKVFS
jgi:hypothetical protein